MHYISKTAEENPYNIPSSISYECRSLVFGLEMMKSLNLDDMSDDEDSEYESETEASENKNEDEFENLFGSTFNYGNASSSEDFQHHANKRKVHAIISGLNLLTYDLDSDLEESGEDIQGELNEEEKDDALIETIIADLASHQMNQKQNPMCQKKTTEKIHMVKESMMLECHNSNIKQCR
eukprot:CAMPEP_0185727600 /NCGR_PEP_ID=MMETSP1171-20130828/3243_1 /TAXON_ID=374046 /ORGANISM="Helicotheca tamensis, Strain CCMP826" /LENGTH=179 /DNA_ID=CAMNT_0028396197 /DNA_START=67 /DNA_END=606 /DNA_ORIENTATION=+